MKVQGKFEGPGKALQDTPYQTFRSAVQFAPDGIFLQAPQAAQLAYTAQGYAHSYRSVAKDVDELQAAFRKAGYGRNSRVALLLENRPDFFRYWLALNAVGASIVPINPEMRADDLSLQLSISKPDILISLPDHMALARAGILPNDRIIDPQSDIPACMTAVSSQHGARSDECAVLFTSGSTGAPKGCSLSNDYFVRIADWYLRQGGIAAIGSEPETSLTPLPFFHMNALGCSAVSMMAVCGTLVPLDRFHASRWWPTVAESKATIIHCLGVIPAILLQLPPTDAERNHHVRFAFAPGVEIEHRNAFEERYNIPIVDAWAMTETGAAACTTTARLPAGFGSRCIGEPCSDMEYRIIDDQGADVDPMQPGEFVVRSKGSDPRQGFFNGYLGDPEATAQSWSGGWFHTGDYIFKGHDCLLYFFDRKKSIIRRSGENIGVLEVEAVLRKDKEVRACAVTPVRDELRGEEVFAFVVPANGRSTNEELADLLLRHCSTHLAYHKLPGYIVFIDELPLSATKKVARGALKEMATKAVQEGQAFDVRKLKGQFRKG